MGLKGAGVVFECEQINLRCVCVCVFLGSCIRSHGVAFRG